MSLQDFLNKQQGGSSQGSAAVTTGGEINPQQTGIQAFLGTQPQGEQFGPPVPEVVLTEQPGQEARDPSSLSTIIPDLKSFLSGVAEQPEFKSGLERATRILPGGKPSGGFGDIVAGGGLIGKAALDQTFDVVMGEIGEWKHPQEMKAKIGDWYLNLSPEDRQRVESGMGKVGELAEKYDEWYGGLSPEAQDAVSLGSFAFDALGFGIGGKGAKAGVKVVKETGEELLEKGVKVGGEIAGEIGEAAGKAGRTLEAGAVAREAKIAEEGIQDLLTPKLTPKQRAADRVRAAKEGRLKEAGTLKAASISPDKKLFGAAEELKKIPEIDTKDSVKALNQIADKQNTITGELQTSLSQIPVSLGDDGADAFVKTIRTQADELPLSAETERMANKMADFVDRKIKRGKVENANDIWQLRKDLDNWSIGKGSYTKLADDKKEALDLVRGNLNDLMDQLAPGTKAEFKTWSNLQNALELTSVNAEAKMASRIGQMVDKVKKIGGLRGSLLAGVTALGLGSAAPAALGTAAAIAAPTYLILKGGKFITSPKVQKALGKMLQGLEKALPKAKAADKKIIKEILDEGKALIAGEKLGLSTQLVNPDGSPMSVEQMLATIDDPALRAQVEAAANRLVKGSSSSRLGMRPETELPKFSKKTKAGAATSADLTRSSKIADDFDSKFQDAANKKDFDMMDKIGKRKEQALKKEYKPIKDNADDLDIEFESTCVDCEGGAEFVDLQMNKAIEIPKKGKLADRVRDNFEGQGGAGGNRIDDYDVTVYMNDDYIIVQESGIEQFFKIDNAKDFLG
ncbi:MAG: hypothetical protein GY861_18630 [bacterium]|nr:hypothetical protein [bacterium]